jgi:hypothetical protein
MVFAKFRVPQLIVLIFLFMDVLQSFLFGHEE